MPYTTLTLRLQCRDRHAAFRFRYGYGREVYEANPKSFVFATVDVSLEPARALTF